MSPLHFSAALKDSYSRQFHYLRLSVTDVCNFRCVYCLPNGYRKTSGTRPELNVNEIRRLVTGFASLGFWKIRLTGGEPTVRHDIVEIAAAVAQVQGIKRVALTTNGYRLRVLAPELKKAGVSAINVSVDSLDQVRFKKITGSDRLNDVLEGVEAALSAGISSIKINAVLLRDINDSELDLFFEYIKDRPISVRFIELMQTARDDGFFERHHLSGGALQLRLLQSGWSQITKEAGGGPAIEFGHPKFAGRIGIIAPYSSDFCKACNRLRVSARGDLRLCLFGTGSLSLRQYLECDGQTRELVTAIRTAMEYKPESHLLKEGSYGDTRNLASFGG